MNAQARLGEDLDRDVKDPPSTSDTSSPLIKDGDILFVDARRGCVLLGGPAPRRGSPCDRVSPQWPKDKYWIQAGSKI